MAYDFQEFVQKADKTLQHIKEDISTLRTGRANTQILDPILVEAYGTMMHVHELANLSAPDPSLLMISPWDKSILGNIEKAIAASALNLHPVVDGSIIRIAIPPLTEERRKEMVKLLGQKIQNGHVMLRNVRGDIRKEIEKLTDQAGVSEDNIQADLADLDRRVKDYTTKIDQLAAEKEKELLTV